ncbi:unnamed protein product [Urochloa humidicola]
MARPRVSGGVLPSVLPLALALVLVAQPAIAIAPEPTSTRSRFPPLLDCAPAPLEMDSAFRANVIALLRAIPSAAAAAPTGFAAAHSGGPAGHGRAFARALCFGANTTSSRAACRACLSAAATDATATGGCAASRRTAVWRPGCFLAYADTGAPSPREDAFRGWFYAAPNTTATLGDRACAGDRTAADCARCFEDAARAAAALGWLARIRGQEVLVVGYGCALRVQISVLPQGSIVGIRGFIFYLWMEYMVLIELAILFGVLCMIIATLALDMP